MDGSVVIVEEQTDVQLAIDHCVVMASEMLQFKSMRELMKKSWFRRYCRGDDSEEVLGISMMTGEEQPERHENCGGIVNMVSAVLVLPVSICAMLAVAEEETIRRLEYLLWVTEK